jgi:GntR family transcriptional regulator, arabinose operon transcriptional repressor
MRRDSAIQPVVAQPGQPLYASVKAAVRHAIDHGAFGPGDQLPSTKALSEQLGVSLVTVHRALQELVAGGVLRRGQGRGTFVHESYRERAGGGAGLRFGLVFHTESSLADYYHGQVLEGVRQAADELGVDLVLLKFGEDFRNECQGYLYVNPLVEQLDRRPNFAGKRGESKAARGPTGTRPVMVVGASFERPGVSTVDTDNVELARHAVEHLAGLGHKTIAYVGGASAIANDMDRRRGFGDGIRDAGLATASGWAAVEQAGLPSVVSPGWRRAWACGSRKI